MIDYYEQHLLGLAVIWCRERGKDLCISHIPGECWHEDEYGIKGFGQAGEPDAEALASLLTDMGVTVPERPSVERVEDVNARLVRGFDGDRLMATDAVDSLQRLYAREPLTVLALLEGGAS